MQQYGHERGFITRRRYDPLTGQFVDEEVPSITLKFTGPDRTSETRAPRGTVEGQYRVTGTNYDLTPGTYGVRFTRVSLSVAGEGGAGTAVTPKEFAGTVYAHHIRHSREGTLLVTLFDRSGRVDYRGDDQHPVVSAGPGTLLWGWREVTPGAMGTRVTFAQTMEAVQSLSIPSA